MTNTSQSVERLQNSLIQRTFNIISYKNAAMPKTSQNPADYIVPLNINGMDGRMLYMPAPKGKEGREILFVYGHHSSLERWWGVTQVLNRYAAVTMPDLPGFGGMDSFYTIGKKPSIDNLADYLAAFIMLRYKRKKIVIAGMSFGFVVATRMLQRYPDLSKRVTLMVSVVGFAHRDDFTFSKIRYYSYLWLARCMTLRPTAWIFRYVFLSPVVLRIAYHRTSNAKHKFAQATNAEEFKRQMDVEIGLWHSNDLRTHMYTNAQFLTLDNCGSRVAVPLWHVSAKTDHFFNHHIVEQHLRIIYKDFHTASADLKNHAPSVIADEKAALPLFPPQLRRVLARLK